MLRKTNKEVKGLIDDAIKSGAKVLFLPENLMRAAIKWLAPSEPTIERLKLKDKQKNTLLLIEPYDVPEPEKVAEILIKGHNLTVNYLEGVWSIDDIQNQPKAEIEEAAQRWHAEGHIKLTPEDIDIINRLFGI